MRKELDVIDLSDLSDEDRREHFRRLDDLNSCPCWQCVRICDRLSTVNNCEPYQRWLERRAERRIRNAGMG
jgi:hypothetical protein